MNEPLRVACIGMGWWSDVLADAMQRSKKLKIAASYTRSEDKRRAFAAKYGCTAAPSYEAILQDRSIEAIRFSALLRANRSSPSTCSTVSR